jgi:hypothetical protein
MIKKVQKYSQSYKYDMACPCFYANFMSFILYIIYTLYLFIIFVIL